MAPEILPAAAAETPVSDPGTLAPGGPRKALAGFFVSGILLAFLGAILPSWGHHLQSDYWMIGLYFVALIAGVLASVRIAPPLMEKKGLGWTLAVRVRVGIAGAAVPGVLFAAVRCVVAAAGHSDFGGAAGTAAHGHLSRHLANVPARSGGHRQSGRDPVRVGLLQRGVFDFAGLLFLHRGGDPNLDCADPRVFRDCLRANAVRSAHGVRRPLGARGAGGNQEPRRGAVQPGFVFSIRQRMGHRRMAAAVFEPASGDEPGGFRS